MLAKRRGINPIEAPRAALVLSLLVLLSLACVREIDRPDAVATPTLSAGTVASPTGPPTAVVRATPEPEEPTRTPVPVAAVSTPQLATRTPPPSPSPTSTASPAPTPLVQAASPTRTPMPPSSPSPTVAPPPSPQPTPTALAVPSPTPSATPAQTMMLDVIGPLEGTTIIHDAVVVFGQTEPGAAVEINGIIAEVDAGGRFEAEITLTAGVNTIETVASNASGSRATHSFEITSLALPPVPLFLVVTEPSTQTVVSNSSIMVSGRTAPGAVVSVNGVSIQVDQIVIFSTSVTMEEGPNLIDVVAADAEGVVLSTVVAVIYRP